MYHLVTAVLTDEGPTGWPSEHSWSEERTSPIKLVVWDLDDTLWRGTLDEGPVELNPSAAEAVRALNRRGIVNAICSKNDLKQVQAALEAVDLWDEFVFVRVDWTAKGPRVAQLVDDAQLRATDVLFIDDLPLNREEVRQAVPGIHTAPPDVIERLLSLPAFRGQEDPGLDRLARYRVLERKLSDRVVSSGDNEAFLRSCDIRIGVFSDAESEVERLFDLVNRTNQLNFTKRRPTREEFDALLADTRRITGYIRVRDRYGDYGICGFFATAPGGGHLTDFLFSCRVLNMGVEQWTYDHLGRPSISVVGDVASQLDSDTVDWVIRDDALFNRSLAGAPDEDDGDQPLDVLLMGGCDLAAAAQFLGGQINTEFSHTGPTGAFIYVGHTETIRQSAARVSVAEQELVDRIPFLDQQVFRSPAVVEPNYDLLVLSVLTDYTQGLYRHRELGLTIPWHQFPLDATDPVNWPWIERRFEREGIDRSFLQWFSEEFEFLGAISADRFRENIRWLAGSVPTGARLILLNGAEVQIAHPNEPDRHLHHHMMNVALDDAVSDLPNASVCDVRTFVLGPNDLAGDIRHYRRHVYLRMAEEIRAIASAGLTAEPPRYWTRLTAEGWALAGRGKVGLRRSWKRLRRQPLGGAPRARDGATVPRPRRGARGPTR